MATRIPYDGGPLNGLIGLPMEVSVEMLNATLTGGAAMAAIAYASKFLAESLRRGEQTVLYECSGVPLIASLVEDENGWYVLVEPVTPAAFSPKKRLELACPSSR